MSEFTPLDIGFSFEGNELKYSARQMVKFEVIIKNIGDRNSPKIYIILTLPPNVKSQIKERSISYLPPNKERKIAFKIKAITSGTYDIMVMVKRKQEIRNLPFKFQAGIPQIQTIRQPVSYVRPSMMKCPYCGSETMENSKFCNNCGKELITKLKESQMKTICPYCGNDTKEDSKFCQSCGHKLDSDICPNCGSSLEEGAQFCGECGHNLE